MEITEYKFPKTGNRVSKGIAIALFCGAFYSCVSYKDIQTVDPEATNQTKALYQNLKDICREHILFGHQDALAYGVNWKEWHKSRSDIGDITGSHPAVFGWEISKLGKSHQNIDSVDFEHMKDWIKEAYKMGGVNTISWHMDNFITGSHSWDVGENVVATILPGGEHHEAYKQKLDVFTDFVNDLKTGFLFKKRIPIILRMFHEHTGSWFWWGQPHCTPEEYKQLWQFTVRYLRDVKSLDNLLFCYSPDVFRDREHYLECYPGDEWVDILGFDDYHDLGMGRSSVELVRRLHILVELTNEKGKLAALTETGQNTIDEPNWWTERLLNPIKSDPVASRIAWILVWRNARTSHHFGPYPGHPSEQDFIDFYNDPVTLFVNELPNLYK